MVWAPACLRPAHTPGLSQPALFGLVPRLQLVPGGGPLPVHRLIHLLARRGE